MTKPPNRRAKINDVALAAGVAIKTVSRVLNNEPNVREETRTRVLEIVKKLNYHPSLSARSLAGRRSYLIGLIYENPSANYIVDVLHGARARCREGRFQLLSHQVIGRSDELERDVLGLVDQTHLDGLIVTAPLSARRACTPIWPSPPTPITTATEPAPSRPSERLTAWYGVRPASVSGAASAGDRSPIGSTHRLLGTSM